MARRVLLATAGLLLAVVGTSPREAGVAAAPGVAPAGRLAGISANFNSGFGNQVQRLAALRRMAAIGVSVNRIDANWNDVERTRGVYDWSSLDYRVAEANQAGLHPRVILAYGNPLYSSTGAAAATAVGRDFGGLPPFGIGSPQYFPPDDTPAGLGAFARWAAALARRYSGGPHGTVRLLEVWNEENGGYRFWEPREDPAWYGDLLKATYSAVKAAVPEDQVAFGGTFYPAVDAHALGIMGVPASTVDTLALPSRGTVDFVEQAFSAHPDLGAYFDAMAYHPYHFPYYAPEVDIPLEGTTEASMDAVRGILDGHGLREKPIWITEVGWPNNTCAYGVSPAKSASYLVRTYAIAWAHHIDQVDWYTYGDGGDPTQDCFNQEAAFGVFDAAGNPKPAYGAWATLDRLMLPLPYISDVSEALGLPPGGRALRFGSGTHAVTVAWLAPESLSSDTGALPAADRRFALMTPPGVGTVVDMSGRATAAGATVELSPYPVYLLEDRGAATVVPAEPGSLPNTAR